MMEVGVRRVASTEAFPPITAKNMLNLCPTIKYNFGSSPCANGDVETTPPLAAAPQPIGPSIDFCAPFVREQQSASLTSSIADIAFSSSARGAFPPPLDHVVVDGTASISSLQVAEVQPCLVTTLPCPMVASPPTYAPTVSDVTPNKRRSSSLGSVQQAPIGGGTPSTSPKMALLTSPRTPLSLSNPPVPAPGVSSSACVPTTPCCGSDTNTSTVPVSELGVESRMAVVLFVSPVDEKCLMASRMFASRLTHYLAWGGDCARMFTVALPHVLSAVPGGALLQCTEPQWSDALTATCQLATEFLGTQHVLGLTATPTAVILGDFASENALATAERSMLSAWENLPGVGTSSKTIGFRYFRFAEQWWEEEDSSLRGDASLASRSFVDVNLSDTAIRMTHSRMGVVCSTVIAYLTQVLPMLAYTHLNEPRAKLRPASDEQRDVEATLHSLPPLFFTRHGQSEYNIEDRLGGNPALTRAGEEDAEVIGAFFEREVKANPLLFGARDELWDATEGFEVWCSQLRRTQQTAQPTADVLTGGVTRRWRSLNEIHAGVCEDMTNQEVMGQFPSLHNFRKLNKVAFRYPSGESYLDLMIRLKPVLLELESTRKCVVVVAHQAVLRTALSYFGGPPVEEAVTAECPHRTVWCCTFDTSGCPRLTTISLPHGDVDRGSARWKGW